MSLPPRSPHAASPWLIEPAIPPEARTILLFGGAFDPPHRGHLELSASALTAIAGDWLLYIPAAKTPLKDVGPSASADDRLAMLRLMIHNQPRTSVCDVELRRGGASYTLDTLRELRRFFPKHITLRLLIGADQAVAFHRWRQPEQVISLAEPLVLLRSPEESCEDVLEKIQAHWTAPQLAQWARRIAPTPLRQVSSSLVRKIIQTDNLSAPQLESALTPEVRNYIAQYRLYTSH